MKILLITTSYPLNSEDMTGIFVKRLAVSMVNAGAQVTVLAPGDSQARSNEVNNGINIIRFWYAPRFLMKIAYGNGGIPENISNCPWLFLILPFFLLSMVIHAVIYSRKCNIIHANWLYTGLMAIPAGIFRRIPLVTTLRGSDFKKQESSIVKFVLNQSNAVTMVSKSWKEYLKTIYGSKILYTPNGVQVTEKKTDVRKKYGIGNDKFIVLFVGSLCKRKGADILAKVADLTKKSSVCFFVVGPAGQEKFKIEQCSNIIYAGKYSPSDVLSIYSSCDIFLLPSRHEGRPNVLLEAMASGIPSIVTPLPGVIDFFTDECGIILKENYPDPDSIANAIILLTRSHGLRAQMGCRAKERIQELSLDWDTCAKTYLKIFGDCLHVRYRRYK